MKSLGSLGQPTSLDQRLARYRDIIEFLTAEDAKTFSENILLDVQTVDPFGRPLDALDRIYFPSYAASQYDPTGLAEKEAIEDAVSNELLALYSQGQDVSHPDYQLMMSFCRPHFIRWITEMHAILSTGNAKYSRKLNKTRTLSPTQVRIDDADLERICTEIGIKMPKGDTWRNRQILNLLKRSGLLMEYRLDLDRDNSFPYTPTPQSFFSITGVITPATFGRARAFCPSDPESMWFCKPWSTSFKLLERRVPFGDARWFWNRVRSWPILSNHDWHLYTSSIYKELVELAVGVMLEVAEEVDSETLLYLRTPSLKSYWCGTLSDYVHISASKILHAILTKPSGPWGFEGETLKGTTLGLPGGWQLSSILHAAGLETAHDAFLRRVNATPLVNTYPLVPNTSRHRNQPLLFLVKGDDGIIASEHYYTDHVMFLLGPTLSLHKSRLMTSNPIWLKRVYLFSYVHGWYRRLAVFHKEIHKEDFFLSTSRLCAALRSCSDQIVASLNGPRQPFGILSINLLEDCWDMLVHTMNIDVTWTKELPDRQVPGHFLYPRWAFGRYLSTDVNWIIEGVRQNLFHDLPEVIHLTRPLTQLEFEHAVGCNVAQGMDLREFQRGLAYGGVQCCWIDNGERTHPINFLLRRVLIAEDIPIPTSAIQTIDGLERYHYQIADVLERNARFTPFCEAVFPVRRLVPKLQISAKWKRKILTFDAQYGPCRSCRLCQLLYAMNYIGNCQRPVSWAGSYLSNALPAFLLKNIVHV